jgi:hypothetical protein
MRLLRLNPDSTLSLTKFTAHNIPPYAILSHTWGDDEVTFNDFMVKADRGESQRAIQRSISVAARLKETV